MEELRELRRHIEAGDYEAALALLDEMEAMARDDKITRIESFMQVLLLHLMKQAIEHRTTKSWDVSILNACDQIRRLNKRRKAGEGISAIMSSMRLWMKYTIRHCAAPHWKPVRASTLQNS
jgi:Domain of unknown function DUF29